MAAQKRKQTPLWVIIVISVIAFAACTNVGSSTSSKKSEITKPTVEQATPSEAAQFRYACKKQMEKYAANKYSASAFTITFLGTPVVGTFHNKRSSFTSEILVDLTNSSGDLMYQALKMYCGTDEEFGGAHFANRS